MACLYDRRRVIFPLVGYGFAFLLGLAVFLLMPALSHAAAADDYKLSSGDILSFDFLDDAELPVTLTITSDGDVQFPYIGDVRIAGRTVTEALAALREEYVTREILKNPRIALNITTFRPIFVLGEVKAPGTFPYYPGLTVEQAIGLAGGIQSEAANPSDKIVARARLRGEIDASDAEILHEAVYAARLSAQLHRKTVVDLKDIPEIARAFVENASAEPVLEIEQRILDTDIKTTKNQVDILSKGINEAEQGLEILAKLEVQQKEVVELNVDDLARVTALRKRELNTVQDLLRAKSSTSNEKARLLEIYAEMSRSRRELGSLRLELAKLQADREKNILLDMQERDIAIKKLIAARRASEEQLFLLNSATFEESKKNKISFSYQIRREIDGHREVITAEPLTEMLPADVVMISIAGI